MATPEEEARFRATLDSKQFRKEQAKLSKEFDKMGRGLGHGNEGFEKLGVNLAETEGKLGKVATGVSGVAGVMGGLAGETNAVVGGFANVVATAAGTGGVGLALVAVAGAATLAAEHFMDMRAAAKAALEEAEKAGRGLVERMEAETEGLKERLEELQSGASSSGQAVKKLHDEIDILQFRRDSMTPLDFLDKDLEGFESLNNAILADKLSFEEADKARRAFRKEHENLNAQIQEMGFVLAEVAPALLENAALSEEITRLEKLEQKARDDQKKAIKDQHAALKALHAEEEAGEDAKRRAVGLGGTGHAELLALQRELEGKRLLRDAAEFEEVIGAERKHKRILELHKKRVVAENKLAKKAAEERKKIHEEEIAAAKAQQDAYLSETQAAASTALAATQVAVEGYLTGNEKAAEQAAVIFLSGLGSQLVGLGTRYAIEGAGVILQSHGTDATGYGLVALGGFAATAGIAMGGVGAVISTNGIPGIGGGASGNRFIDDAAARAGGRPDPLASGGVSAGTDLAASGSFAPSTTGGGADQVIQQTYVFNAPVFNHRHQTAAAFDEIDELRADLLR